MMLHPNVAAERPRGESGTGHRAGAIVALSVGVVLLAIAASVDFPKTGIGFKGDEATYYMMAHSLARDGDLTYERRDLIRVWEEYHAPEGVFLKRGKTLRLTFGGGFPFIHRIKADDPVTTRLYFGKPYIYSVAAAPFVWALGTNGFLVLHALLIALDLWLGYLWLAARGSGRRAASAFALVFLLASVTPVYFVWLAPEIFNFSLAFIAVFLWSYKEVAPGAGRFLAGAGSDLLAAVLIGVLTYSKPTHAPLIAPVMLLAAARGQWLRAFVAGALFVIAAGGLFAINAAVTGEFNYQGGYRKTFYSSTGFPFANERETFDNTAPIYGRSEVQEEMLVTGHTLEVLRKNLLYFVVGRHSGLLPYFFPGLLAFALFLVYRRTRFGWQWLLVGTMVIEVFALIFITPYTWAGGGGPIGNRYFLSFYPLFLFLMPPVNTLWPALAALVVGAAFTAKIVFNPFWSSFNYGNHVKAGPLRLLPIELTMLNDLPVAAQPDRSRKRLRAGVLAYFPDDNTFPPEGEVFWVRGKRRADVILRAPLEAAADGRWLTREIDRLEVHVRNGIRRNAVTIDTGAAREVLDMNPGEERRVTLAMPRGVPYRPYDTPTSFVYAVSFRTTAGFVPFLETPPSSDARFLGAAVTLTPVLR